MVYVLADIQVSEQLLCPSNSQKKPFGPSSFPVIKHDPASLDNFSQLDYLSCCKLACEQHCPIVVTTTSIVSNHYMIFPSSDIWTETNDCYSCSMKIENLSIEIVLSQKRQVIYLRLLRTIHHVSLSSES